MVGPGSRNILMDSLPDHLRGTTELYLTDISAFDTYYCKTYFMVCCFVHILHKNIRQKLLENILLHLFLSVKFSLHKCILPEMEDDLNSCKFSQASAYLLFLDSDSKAKYL